MKLTRHQLHFA